MVAAAVKRRDEALMKKQYGVQHWIHDLNFQAAEERLVSQPTVNIEGLYWAGWEDDFAAQSSGQNRSAPRA